MASDCLIENAIMSSILIHIECGVSCHQASSHCLINSTVRRTGDLV